MGNKLASAWKCECKCPSGVSVAGDEKRRARSVLGPRRASETAVLGI